MATPQEKPKRPYRFEEPEYSEFYNGAERVFVELNDPDAPVYSREDTSLYSLEEIEARLGPL